MTSALSQEISPDELAPTRSPFLRRVKIRGYKSIAFCDVSLEPLTILVGRNSAGKSNFLDALAFLRDLLEMRATEAVNKRNGWNAIHCRHELTSTIEIEIEASFESINSTWNAVYGFSLELMEQKKIRVQQEELTLTENGTGNQCKYELTDGNPTWTGLESFSENPSLFPTKSTFENPALVGNRRYDRLELSLIGTQPFVDFAEKLRASGVYNFQPSAIRGHKPNTARPILERDGANLARAIEGLRELEPETLDRIRQYLKTIVPDITSFRTQEYGDYETIRFTMESKNNGKPLEFDASSMSDGTLRILASLVGAFQVVLPTGFPGFIGIEEPETALHSAAMRSLVDALDEATLRTQILLTTHSSEMLDNPTILPANIRVVQMIDGKTVIASVDEASVEIVQRKLDTLGGLERENQLEPNADDLKRQEVLAAQEQE